MRLGKADADLSRVQSRAADLGSKAMMPLAFGRPFLDWVLSALADAGIREVCLVVAPDHSDIRNYYSALTLTRIRISFAVQLEPRGTADALLAAEAFAKDEVVLVLNADNYYPAEAYRALVSLGTPAMVAFDRSALLAASNIEPERVAQYALVEIDDEGFLRRIVEKPDETTLAAWSGKEYVSMNLWALPPNIYAACRAIRPSARGEFELPAAVQYAMDEMGAKFRAIPMRGAGAGVLDLSNRGDISAVTARLSARRPVL